MRGKDESEIYYHQLWVQHKHSQALQWLCMAPVQASEMMPSVIIRRGRGKQPVVTCGKCFSRSISGLTDTQTAIRSPTPQVWVCAAASSLGWSFFSSEWISEAVCVSYKEAFAAQWRPASLCYLNIITAVFSYWFEQALCEKTVPSSTALHALAPGV